MKTLVISLLLVTLSSTALARSRYRPGCRQEGQSCTPRRYHICGDKVPLGEEAVPSGRHFGSNVCRSVFRIAVNSSKCMNTCRTTYWGRQHCRLQCSSTERCDASINVTSRAHCCDGYTTMSGRKYRSKLDCPIKLEDSVADCLEKLNLTTLSDLLSQQGLESSLSNQSNRFTVFAPSQDALSDLNVGEVDDLTTLLSSHLVCRALRSDRLFGGRRIPTLADGRFIQTTSVRVPARGRRYSQRLFVNGVEVTGADACFARNGVVHVINGVIMSSNESISEVIRSNSELSTFSQLVQKANLTKLLKKGLFTVFAPANDGIGSAAQECLCRPENTFSLVKFLLFHILYGAEYNSTLTLRKTVYPKLCYYYYCKLSVSVEEGRVSVGGVDIVDADIPASNGVVHVISKPLNVSSKLDLNRLCPPPTTAPTNPTSEEPTTTPTNATIATSEEPTTTPTNGTMAPTSETPSETPTPTEEEAQ